MVIRWLRRLFRRRQKQFLVRDWQDVERLQWAINDAIRQKVDAMKINAASTHDFYRWPGMRPIWFFRQLFGRRRKPILPEGYHRIPGPGAIYRDTTPRIASTWGQTKKGGG